MTLPNVVNIGTDYESGDGDRLRDAFAKLYGNDQDLDARVTALAQSVTNQIVTAGVVGSAPIARNTVAKVGMAGFATASIDDPDSFGKIVGLVAADADPGVAAQIVTGGPVLDATWAWTRGAVYLGLNGALTQTEPTTGFVVCVGLSDAPNRIIVDVGPCFLLPPAPPSVVAGGDGGAPFGFLVLNRDPTAQDIGLNQTCLVKNSATGTYARWVNDAGALINLDALYARIPADES